MNTATRARKGVRRALVVGIVSSMLAVAGPAHAGVKGGGGGGGVKLDNDTAISSGGDGGNGGIGINAVLLNCLILLVDCGEAGPLGGGNAFGGAGGAANAQNFS